jgi:hypothetical protein
MKDIGRNIIVTKGVRRLVFDGLEEIDLTDCEDENCLALMRCQGCLIAGKASFKCVGMFLFEVEEVR